MKVLLLGSGGREHAMAWKIAQSPQLTHLYIAPGNPGTTACGQNVTISTTDFPALKKFCIEKQIDIVVVGPEDPLVKGIVDYFQNDDSVKHIPVIGPNKTAAQMEGSKAFAKAFMLRNHVQTPAYKEFTKESIDDAVAYLKNHSLPVVLKADGLAAGKGVVICEDHAQAVSELQLMMSGKFGEAGDTVVIEQFLTGMELTVIILTDGENYMMLPPSKDYKKIGDGDTGLNTGGMGAISPPPFATENFLQKVKEKIIHPTLHGLKKENILYKGFLYFGLFKCGDEPFVIEYNARMGDPETQVIMPRIKNDILDLYKAVAENTLGNKVLEVDERACTTVILASHGYPSAFEKDKVITGIENTENCMVFQAGTKMDENNNLLTNGGRVLAVSSYGKDLSDALQNCYANAGRIYFESRYFRRDIGWDV
ncbi:MAG: phosphoribosylamine--glycine ligase [Chitinophagales bacterium]